MEEDNSPVDIKILTTRNGFYLHQLSPEEQVRIYGALRFASSLSRPIAEAFLQSELELQMPQETSTVPEVLLKYLSKVPTFNVTYIVSDQKIGGKRARFFNAVVETRRPTVTGTAAVNFDVRVNILVDSRKQTGAPGSTYGVTGVVIGGPVIDHFTHLCNNSVRSLVTPRNVRAYSNTISVTTAELTDAIGITRLYQSFLETNTRYLFAAAQAVAKSQKHWVNGVRANSVSGTVTTAEDYAAIAKLLRCRIGSNYVMATVADLVNRNIDPEDPLVISKIEKALVTAQLARKVTWARQQEESDTVIYSALIMEKFGGTGLAKYLSGGKSHKARMASLEASMRNIILKEHESRERYLKAVESNNCPHIPILYKLRTSKATRELERNMEALQEYIPKAAADAVVVCTRCNLPIICPHLLKLISLEIKRRPYNEIKHALEPFTMCEGLSYYCNICGETLSHNEEETDHKIIDDELAAYIGDQVVRSIRSLVFPPLLLINVFIRRVRDAVYPYIYEIEKRLLKSKVNVAEELNAKKLIFTIVYIYAMFIHSCDAKSGIAFRDFTAKTPKSELLDTFKHVIGFIMYSYNTTIRQIPGMSLDSIKTHLVEAYNVLKQTEKIVLKPPADNLLEYLEDDAVYKYIATWVKGTPHEVLGKEAFEKSTKKGITGSKNATGTKDISCSKDIFAHVKEPRQIAWWPSNTPLSEPLPAAPLACASVIHFIYGLKLQLYLKAVHTNIGYDRDAGIVRTELSRDHAAYLEAYKELLPKQSEYLLHRNTYYRKGYSTYKIKQSRAATSSTLVANIGRLYDVHGQPHKWTGELVCSVCGITMADAEKSNESKIYAAITVNNDKENFYRYYQERCPENGIHEGSPCTKCGFPGAPDYFEKYYKKYQANREVMTKESRIEASIAKPQAPEMEFEAFQDDFSLVVKLAEALKVNRKLLENLGSIEGAEYVAVQSGDYIPPPPETTDDAHIYNLCNRVITLLTEYNQVRFFHLSTRLSLVVDFMKVQGVEKYKMEAVGRTMPDVYDHFNERFRYYARTLRPVQLKNWLLQRFCEKCLRILNEGGPESAALRKAFVSYICKKLFHDDELSTKRGWFNMSLLYGDKEQVTTAKYDTEAERDDPKDPDEPDDKPFSTDGFDMEDGFVEEGEEVEIRILSPD